MACDPQDLLDANPCLSALSPFAIDVILAEALCSVSQSIEPVAQGTFVNPDLGGAQWFNPDVGAPIQNPDI